MVFKLRAECMKDVGALLLRLHAQRVEIWVLGAPGPEQVDSFLPFGSAVEAVIHEPSIAGHWLDLASLRSIAAEVEDGHVMAETLATLAEYTGERSYGESKKGKA